MQPFDFESVASETTALSAFKKSERSRFLAGGTTLVDLMKLHVETPDRLVDITPLHWRGIRDVGSSVEIGALVPNSELAEHATILEHFPVLSEAILAGASPQLRNLATTGGNILQRTRCPYFRDLSLSCNKREPGSGCGAIDGMNRNLAIFGVSKSCIASNPSDMNVALAALDAVVHVIGESGKRKVPFHEFHLMPGETPHVETSLRHGELISAIEIPKKKLFKKSHYVKVRDRNSYAFALTSVAIALDLHNGIVDDVRIALGGVGTVPWRAKESERILRGQRLTPALIERATTTLTSTAQPRPGNLFKVSLAQRTLASALQKAGGLT